MTIALSCPECEADFKVKDEFAGKKIRCPECKALVTVPVEEEEKPVKPRRTAKRKHVEDDEEKALLRNNNLLWITGGSGLAVVVALVLFLVLKPAGKRDGDDRQDRSDDNSKHASNGNAKVQQTTLDSIKVNMPLSEVEARVGKGEATDEIAVFAYLNGLGGTAAQTVRTQATMSGVKNWHVWHNGNDRLHVGTGLQALSEPVALAFFARPDGKGGHQFFMGDVSRENVNQGGYDRILKDPRWLKGPALQKALIGEWIAGAEVFDFKLPGQFKFDSPIKSYNLLYKFKGDQDIEVTIFMAGSGQYQKFIRILVDDNTLYVVEIEGGKVVKFEGPFKKLNS